MLSDFFVNTVEDSSFYGKHHKQTVIVRKRQVFRVVRNSLPRERQRGDSVDYASRGVINPLGTVKERLSVPGDPRVHQEGSSGFVHPPEYSISLTLQPLVLKH